MVKFTIRDVFWLTLMVGLSIAWASDRSRLTNRMQGLEDIATLETLEAFPRNWEGITAGIRNENRLLRFQVESLKHELQSRGHNVEVHGSKVWVDSHKGGKEGATLH